MVWFVYIVECKDNTLYTGIAKDLDARLEEHNTGVGAKYTRGRFPVRLVYFEEHLTRSDACKREYEIKRFSRRRKIKLAESLDL